MPGFTELQLGITFSLVTLIWLIQILHYPMFTFIGDENFRTAMAFHQKRVSYIVIPLMLTEVALSLYGAYSEQPAALIILFLVTLIWLSTALVQVRLHQELSLKKNQRSLEGLIRSNWIRTILWTVKAVLVIGAVN